MERLFYSEVDKRLFYVPNYYTGGTGMLKDLRKGLEDGEAQLRKHVKEGDIYCSEILHSRRYKSMWYFAVHCDTPPQEAFKLGPDWTMWAWLTA